MTTVSQRAERLDIIRDLVVLGVGEQIHRRAKLQERAISENLLVRISDGKPLGYTSRYRYLDALRFLKLDISKEYGVEDDIVWSSTADELAQYGGPNYRAERLSAPEKDILRRSVFASDASRQFLSFFCEDRVVPHSQERFVSLARPLYVVNVSVKRPAQLSTANPEWPARKNVEITFDPLSGEVMRRSTKEFLYTYRYWCLDTDIIEELNVREAERCGIPKLRSYVLFPLNPTLAVTAEDFLELLYSSLGEEVLRPRAVPIPWLMYQICPSVGMSVGRFRSLLLDSWQENRQLLHLERGAGGLIQGRIQAPDYEYSQRYGNQRYYLVVRGTVRSHLILFPRT